MTSQPQPHAFIILGATGDLTRRKLLRAFDGLCQRKQIAPESFILGVSRDKSMDDAKFAEWAQEALTEAGVPAGKASHPPMYYFGLGNGTEADYQALGKRLKELETQHNVPGNRIFYLALPPGAFAPTISALGEIGLNRSQGWTRLVIEKPFGHDLASARELTQQMHKYFKENQIYLIDHYLGKQTVQNLLVFRFANAIFESQWNRDKIECVQITVAEDIGLAGRAGYYDHSGALRDMVQNHISQILALIAMEIPEAYQADAIRYEKTKLMRSVVPLRPNNAVFGQYAAGRVRDKDVSAYRDETGVTAGSTTETFVAMRLEIANWRWQGVPFYIRTGKRLPRRITEIAVAFRRPPASLFKTLGLEMIQRDVLRINVQPDEGFSLNFNVKAPGQALELRSLPLHFRYDEAFGPPRDDAYETLIFDAMNGDQSLFVNTASVEAAWELYAPLLNGSVPVHPYESGTWGPAQADLLLDAGERWLTK